MMHNTPAMFLIMTSGIAGDKRRKLGLSKLLPTYVSGFLKPTKCLMFLEHSLWSFVDCFSYSLSKELAIAPGIRGGPRPRPLRHRHDHQWEANLSVEVSSGQASVSAFDCEHGQCVGELLIFSLISDNY